MASDALTVMGHEACESGQAAARFLQDNRAVLDDVAGLLRQSPIRHVVTCARGSSDHAATYAKYLIEARLGITTASAAFSTVSLLDAPLRRSEQADVLCLAVSQSGRSPDMLAAVNRHRDAGAKVIALVNDAQSPLAEAADVVLPLSAGPERAVAATKSFICSLVGIAALVAAWDGDRVFADDVNRLPAELEQALTLDWSPALDGLVGARNLFVIGRGYGLALAQEAALKLKETSGLHAEAFSAAEVRHGPMAIVRDGFPVLAFATPDAAGDDVRQVCEEFASRGARVWLAGAGGTSVRELPVRRMRAELSPVTMAASFYRMANSLALARGYDPDNPPYLKKVTETL